MKYQATGTQMWDGWFLNDNGRIHMYHMQVPKKSGGQEINPCQMTTEQMQSVGHAYTDDLIHWTECPAILPPLFDQNPDDYHQKFTGCAVQKDGKYYVYYTMRDKTDGSQRIGVAISDDNIHFIPYQGNPVLEPRGNGLIGFHNRQEYDWGIVDCRDLILVPDPQKDIYYGYFAAAADVGREHPVGVVAMAETTDMLHFSEPRIVYTPRQNGMGEVPDVFYMDGKWYLTLLTGANYAGRDAVGEEFITNCTIWATADSPYGPFQPADQPLLIAGRVNSGFTCRSVEKDGSRYLYYIDRNYTGDTDNSLAIPKLLKTDQDGRLKVFWADCVEGLRKQEITLPGLPAALPNSFAWRTFGGHCTGTDGTYVMQTGPHDSHIAAWDMTAQAIEWNIELTLECTAGGFYLGGDKKFAVLFEPDAQRLAAYELYDYILSANRHFCCSQGQTYNVKLLFQQGVVEVYVNNVLILQNGLDLHQLTHLGFFCERGSMTAVQLSLFELEE